MTDHIQIPVLAGGDQGTHLIQTRVPYPDAAILEGDWLVIHQQDTAKVGQLVVLMVNEGATVRRYTNGDAEVLGLVVGLMRSLVDVEKRSALEEGS